MVLLVTEVDQPHLSQVCGKLFRLEQMQENSVTKPLLDPAESVGSIGEHPTREYSFGSEHPRDLPPHGFGIGEEMQHTATVDAIDAAVGERQPMNISSQQRDIG